jgi:hypothetical protein
MTQQLQQQMQQQMQHHQTTSVSPPHVHVTNIGDGIVGSSNTRRRAYGLKNSPRKCVVAEV